MDTRSLPSTEVSIGDDHFSLHFTPDVESLSVTDLLQRTDLLDREAKVLKRYVAAKHQRDQKLLQTGCH